MAKLDVYYATTGTEEAMKVHAAAHREPAHVGKVHEGGFCMATREDPRIFLSTDGAATCTIILVHASNGTGAVGHHPATDRCDHIVAGARQMVKALGTPPIDSIVFSAGLIEREQKQRDFEESIVALVRREFSDALVRWLPRPNGDLLGGCIYHPAGHAAAFWEEVPKCWSSGASGLDGVAIHNFRTTG